MAANPDIFDLLSRAEKDKSATESGNVCTVNLMTQQNRVQCLTEQYTNMAAHRAGLVSLE